MVKKLEDENAAVFGGVLRTVAVDMKEVKELLEAQDTGTYTQRIENEIITQLNRLIASLKQEITNRKQDGGGGGGGGGGGKRPLIPPVAELKMLDKLETETLQQTKELDDALQQGGG